MDSQIRSGGLAVYFAVAAGVAIAWLWSFHFVDVVIGDSVANGLLGYDAKGVPIGSLYTGAVFALITGIAGTFTACNVCVASCIGPMSSQSDRFSHIARSLGLMLLGALTVSFLYGYFGVQAAAYLPQLSDGLAFGVYPDQLFQASLVFTVIGLMMLIFGLTQQYPAPFTMGMIFGAFLIGRPFPLFRQLFDYAAQQSDPLYGAAVFCLQAIGNLAIVAVLILAIALSGRRVNDWVRRHSSTIAAVGFTASGAFLITYWSIRVPARFLFSF